MTNAEVWQKVQEVFTAIKKISSVNDLQAYLTSLGYEEAQAAYFKKYPPLDFQITSDDIAALRRAKCINASNEIIASSIKDKDPLTKLLYALIWKNGDVVKLKHIINGICSPVDYQFDDALVFQQFGKSLQDKSEPIVDQHVLRAFAIFNLKQEDHHQVFILQHKAILKSADRGLLSAYKVWIQERLATVPVAEQARYKTLLDNILFILGKELKIKKEKKASAVNP